MHESLAASPNLKNRDSSDMRRLIVEGWRFIPHSYAIANQFQCLEMLKRKDLMLYHRDLPFFNPNWTPVNDLFSEDAELKLRTIPTPPEDIRGDVLFRIGYPYDFRQSSSSKTFVFGTSEHGAVYDSMLWGNIPLQEVLKDSDVGIIVPSNWSKCGFVRSGAEPERITVIPLGVDTRIFKPSEDLDRSVLREKFGWYNSFVFLNIGAMTVNKGIIFLLKSFAEIATKYPDVKLVLKGMDSLYTSKKFLTDIKSRLSAPELDIIAPRMEYIGGTSSFADIADLYQSADCYVSPYLAEGFNMPVLEAAACGLPIICTEGGSTDDFVTEDFALRIKSEVKEYRAKDSIMRMLIPDGEHLTTLMSKIIDDSVWRDSACKSGPAFVNQNFTWEYVTKQLLNTFFEPDQNPAYSYQERERVRPRKPENEGDTMGSYDRRESGGQGRSFKSPVELYEEVQNLMKNMGNREVIGALVMFLAEHPDYAPAHNDLGVLYFDEGKKEKSLQHYQMAAELEPENPIFQKNLADFLYAVLGQVEDALVHYAKTLSNDPNNIDTLLMLAHISVSKEKFDEAKIFYNKVLEIEPSNADARGKLGQMGEMD